MQYVEVAVNSKTKPGEDVFTYKIPPEFLPYIKKGILVEVPFRSGIKEAVVIGIKSHAESDIKKLRSIKKIISSQSILDSTHLGLAKWLARYYWSSLGEVIFIMIPSISRRLAKKVSPLNSQNIFSLLNHKTFQYPPLIYTIHDRFNNRLNIYSQLIQKTLAKKKQCLILFPNTERAEYFLRWTKKNLSEEKTIIYHHQLKKTDRYRVWQEIAEGKYNLIVGTRSAVFAPLVNLDLIIIDGCNDRFSYKEEQSPYYDTATVAKKISRLAGGKLVLGDLIPSLENYFYLEKGMYRPMSFLCKQESRINLMSLTLPRIHNSNQLSVGKIQTINMNNYPSDRILSYELEEKIRKTLNEKQKILLFLNRKGKNKIWFCRDCEEILREDEKYILSKCNQCGGTNLKEIGIDIPKAVTITKALFPQAKIAVLQKENQISIIPAKAGIYSDCDILFTTSALFYYSLDLKNIGLTAVISIDCELNFPDFRTSENIFLLLTKINTLAPKTIIQTNFPENPVITALTTADYQKFYENELKSLRQFDYPPYSQLIKLSFNKNYQEKIIDWLRSLNINNDKLSFLQKPAGRRGRQESKNDNNIQAVIKLKNTTSFLFFKKVFSNKTKLNWSKIKIKVDPII